MAWPCSSVCITKPSPSQLVFIIGFVVLSLLSSWSSCYGLGTFGFDIHHRFSDPVNRILGNYDVPRKGTPQYYAAMLQRDRFFFRGRRLAADDHRPLTFSAGNDTYQLGAAFGFLHFANVSVGTPPLWFLVALDTGSDLFWLPCNCTSCVHGLKTHSGEIIPLNIYDLEGSSTSKNVLCGSNLCQETKCTSSVKTCRYRVDYLSANTSSTGFLVEDVLHLVTDDYQAKYSDAKITFGCGKVQTGAFLKGAAPNGLLGLGIDSVSVPSILSNEGLTSNSFSMCFGSDGLGRITFGDSGSSNQGKTPFNLRASHPTYNITVTQIIVGGNVTDLEFHAIFDTGTSYTYLNDPAYSAIAEKFNSLIKAKRYSSKSSDYDLPFEYCYEISSNQPVEVPFLNLTMKGGDNYFVMDPLVQILIENGGDFLCLAIQKSDIINIIGQNFMTGYHIVFDRDSMNLGWKEANCYDLLSDSLPPINPPAVSPAMAVNPVVTSDPSSSNPGRVLPNNSSFMMKSSLPFIIVLFSLLAIF